jgi:hypothetical protein
MKYELNYLNDDVTTFGTIVIEANSLEEVEKRIIASSRKVENFTIKPINHAS